MEPVRKTLHDEPMRIGIGTKDEARALGELHCDQVVDPADFARMMGETIKPLRPDAGDVVVIVNPKALSMNTIQHVVNEGVPIEVAGHDPEMPRTYEERRALRAKAANVGGEDLPDRRGRPREHDIADAHIQAAIADWHAGEYVENRWRSTYTPAGIMERARLRTGLDLPKHWARNVVIAEYGSAVRNPHDIPKKEPHTDG